MRAHGMRNSNQILDVVKLDERRSTTPLFRPKFCDTNADAAAKLIVVRGLKVSLFRWIKVKVDICIQRTISDAILYKNRTDV